MLAILAAALASPFDGVWTLDPDASEPIGEILAAQGLSWIERTLAESGAPTHTIRTTRDQAVVDVRSGWYRRQDVLHLDGVARRVDVARVGEVEVASELRGDALITRAVLPLRDGRTGVLCSERRVLDADTLLLVMTFESPDGEVLSADRVFRRED